MTDATALMLQTISKELSQNIIPAISVADADAIERANLSAQILQHLAADIDILVSVADSFVPLCRDTLKNILSSLPNNTLHKEHLEWNAQLAAIASETDIAKQREVNTLRLLAANILRKCSDLATTLPLADERKVLDNIIIQLGALDHRWLTAYNQAKQENLTQSLEAQPSEKNDVSPPPAAEVTPSTVTDYLRNAYPQAPAIQCTKVVAIPGGRSKKTWLLSLENADNLPAELVMRQDYQLHYEGTKVRDEYQPLSKLAALDLPVPKPLLLEESDSILGQPFLLMEKASGSPPGSYFGLKEKCPGAFADLARTLAKVHTANPQELGYTLGDNPQNNLVELINSYQDKWRSNTRKPSPLIDFAYAWAQKICNLDQGMVAVVHGDAGPHNILVADDRLQALLDWEFSHVGDPAEDLGIVRVYAEDIMDWDDFMALYIEAGGLPVPNRRVEMAMLLHYLKGACLVAVSNRNFEEGWTTEFIKGGTAFSGLRQIELIVAGMLKRFGAIQ